MVKVSKETVDTALKVGGFIAGVGLAAYVVQSIVSPSPQCNNPSSACYQALQPYESELQTCAQEYTLLMNEVVQGGTLTTSQQQALAQLRACMDSASQSIGQTAGTYNEGSVLNQILDYIGITVGVVVFLKYGLPGISSFYNSVKGSLKTPPRGGAGIAAVITNVSILFGINQGVITAAQASAIASGLPAVANDQIAGVDALWNTLAADLVVSQQYALSDINFLSNSIGVDTSGVISALGAL